MDSVKILLSFGADTEAKGREGRTALMHAAFLPKSDNYKEIAHLLVAKGANVNTEDQAGNTAVIIASLQGGTDLVKLLLEHGADANHIAKDGFTALRLAKQYNLQDMINLLEQYGAKESVQETDL